jgi:glycine cleavage system H protein
VNVDGSAYADVGGYRVALDRHYDADTHVWVSVLSPDRVRIGMDPLGVETSGTLAQLSFLPVGTSLMRGQAFGGLEAAKFVGPLTTPLTGEVLSCNEAVLANPGLPEVDPFDAGWLIDLRPTALDDELPKLVSGADVTQWFADRLADYRLKGVVAQ